MADLVIRDFDRKEVKRIPMDNCSPRHVERVMRGALINMNTDKYFIDDSECTAAWAAREAAAKPPEGGA